MLAQSSHRTLDPEEADYFYLPIYVRCLTSFICERLACACLRRTAWLRASRGAAHCGSTSLFRPSQVQMLQTSRSSTAGPLPRGRMLPQTCEHAAGHAAWADLRSICAPGDVQGIGR